MTARERDAGLPELFHAHYRRLLALAVLVTDDRATAEDLVQEAFARLHGRHLADADKALAYLRATVLNLSRSRLRRLRTARKHERPDDAALPSAEEHAVLRADQRAVLDALRTLSPRQRQALVLRYWEDMSEAQVAAAMGLSNGAVKSHTARGIAALRKTLRRTDERPRHRPPRRPVRPRRRGGARPRGIRRDRRTPPPAVGVPLAAPAGDRGHDHRDRRPRSRRRDSRRRPGRPRPHAGPVHQPGPRHCDLALPRHPLRPRRTHEGAAAGDAAHERQRLRGHGGGQRRGLLLRVAVHDEVQVSSSGSASPARRASRPAGGPTATWQPWP